MRGWLWILGLGSWVVLGNILETMAQIFRHPVDGLPLTSGVFGELRTNHLHSGLDYRTGGNTGIPVLASASGHVSRIKTSATGYGLAVYLDHPNGYTTVYAHLERYASPLAEWVKARHYQYQQFELDLALRPGEILVRQGQIIGYSGNSGDRGGRICILKFAIPSAKPSSTLNGWAFAWWTSKHPIFNPCAFWKYPVQDGVKKCYEKTTCTLRRPPPSPAAKDHANPNPGRNLHHPRPIPTPSIRWDTPRIAPKFGLFASNTLHT